MSLNAYVTFLLKRFKYANENPNEVSLFSNLSSRWFGLLPFWWKCIVHYTKK